MSEILKRQLENTKMTYKLTKEFIKKYPEFSHYEYSFLWIGFNFLMNNNYTIKKKIKKLKIELPFNYEKKQYYMTFGKTPDFSNTFKKLKEIKIKLNSKGINVFYGNKFYFSPIYKKSKISIEADNKIYELFNKFINVHNDDMNRFERYLINIFKYNKPLFILLDEDRTKYKRILIKIAKKYNIKTFVIQHGITPYKKENKIPLANASFTPIYADYFLAWGEKSRNFLVNTGNDKEKILIVGNPHISHINKNIMGKEQILIIDQQFDSQYDERHFAYSQLIEILKEQNIKFDIYLRKNCNKKYFQTSYSNVSIINWEKNKIFEEILKHKIIIGFNSSAILEATLLNRPVVIFDYFNKGDDMGFESKTIKIANNTHKLIKLINYFYNKDIDKKDFDDSLKEHFSIFGEEAINNIAGTVVAKVAKSDNIL